MILNLHLWQSQGSCARHVKYLIFRSEFGIKKGLFIKMELSWENGNFLHFLKSFLSVPSSPRVFYYKWGEEGRRERRDSRECEISRLSLVGFIFDKHSLLYIHFPPLQQRLLLTKGLFKKNTRLCKTPPVDLHIYSRSC